MDNIRVSSLVLTVLILSVLVCVHYVSRCHVVLFLLQGTCAISPFVLFRLCVVPLCFLVDVK